jgi:hypothetical protein
MLTRDRKKQTFAPTTGPQPQTGTGTQQTDTGAHTGSAGPHSGHPHTYAPRAPTDSTKDITTVPATKSREDVFTGKAESRGPIVGTLVAAETLKKLRETKLSGLPDITSDNINLVRLARANYIAEQNKYNFVL